MNTSAVLSKKMLRLLPCAVFTASSLVHAQQTFAWRYYRPSNTGIQGDYCDAMYVGPDGDPWIGGYDPSFEEGGIAKYIQAENRWVNISNVDYPQMGHPDDQGVARVSDIVADASGVLWMGTGHGALKFDPAVGPSSLVRFDATNSPMRGGWVEDVDIAPDGSIWFSAYTTVWGEGGMYRYVPATNTWTRWAVPHGTIAAQRKPSGGYYIWASQSAIDGVTRFDSTTNAWTNFPRSAGSPGELTGPDASDDAGNVWMQRYDNEFASSLNCRRPDGSWIHPTLPPLVAMSPAVWALRAFGNGQVLLTDGSSRIWHFDGTAWRDKGIWREGAYTSDLHIDNTGTVWACGIGGAAKRDPQTGAWQRHRVTNSSQFDFFCNDLSVDQASGDVWACANAGPGFGGMVRFDGARWIGYNQAHYGLGQDWPFNTDNSESVYVRPNGAIVVNPMFGSTHQLHNGVWSAIPGGASTVKSYQQDSLGRLWGLGEYFSLGTYTNGGFNNFSIAAWGQRMQVDPSRAGTVWANAGFEVVRTDGTYRFARTIDDFPELTSQSDTFSGLAVAPDGSAWLGCTVMLGAGGTGGGLVHISPSTGTSTLMTYESGWPLPGQYVQPLAVTPDGKVWMQYDSDFLVAQRGICWYDGTNVGIFPAPPQGQPQWGGLPHAGITDLEVRIIDGGYELWMSCASRGIAVLKVLNPGGTCNSIDFNNDSLFPDDNDLVDFLSVLAGGACSNDPNCNDIDFDNDGLFPDDNDLLAFLRVLAGGSC